MGILARALLASSLLLGCTVDSADGNPVGDDDALTSAPPVHKSYAGATGWTAVCAGPSLTQADLGSMLGKASSKSLGRFQIVARDVCSPWVNGGHTCGPSGETLESSNGTSKFAFGLAPSSARFASWRFTHGPLLVRDTGDVIARRLGNRILVQLVGDASAVDIGNERALDGTVTGTTHLRGRVLSSDILRTDGMVRGSLRMAVGENGQPIGVAAIDPEVLRYTSPPQPISDLSESSTTYGTERWSSVSVDLTGNITATCLRLTDGMHPTSLVVTSTFTPSSAK